MGKQRVKKPIAGKAGAAVVTKASPVKPTTPEKASNSPAVGAQKPKGKITKKKKDKRKEKRDNFLAKLQAAKVAEEAAKKSEQPLQLSSLSELLNSLLEKEEEKAKPTDKVTKKTRAELMEKEVTQFKNVVAHPAFQGNPMATIREHLTNKVAATEKAFIDEKREQRRKEKEEKRKQREKLERKQKKKEERKQRKNSNVNINNSKMKVG